MQHTDRRASSLDFNKGDLSEESRPNQNKQGSSRPRARPARGAYTPLLRKTARLSPSPGVQSNQTQGLFFFKVGEKRWMRVVKGPRKQAIPKLCMYW